MEQQEKYLVLIHKYITKQLSATEEQNFNIWLEQDTSHQQLLEDTLYTWTVGESYKEDYTPDVGAGWKKVQQHINSNGTVVVLSPSRNRWWMAAAAVLLMAGGLLWMMQDMGNNVRMLTANSASTPVVKLADGSIVTLNENTTLIYPEKFTAKERVVKLQGEAFFDVTKNSTQAFSVETANVDVKVLGTSFNVRAITADTNTEVTVSTGKVSLITHAGKSLILIANDKGILDHSTGVLSKAKDAKLNALSWKTGELKFDATPMKEVLLDLERRFKIEIDYQDLNIPDCQHTGEVFSEDGLTNTFGVLQTLYGVKVKMLDKGKYSIKGGKCVR